MRYPFLSGQNKPSLAVLSTIALIAYWLLLFVATHIPTVPPPMMVASDKTMHLVAYAGLAFLVAVNSWFVPWPSWMMRVGILLAFAGFDEITQPLVGRYCDSWDVLADIIGVSLGLMLAGIVRWPVMRTASFALRTNRN